MPRNTLRAALISVALILGLAAPASAATLTNTGGTLTYAGAAGTNSVVAFEEAAADTVDVYRSLSGGGNPLGLTDNDPITPSGCTLEETTADFERYRCTGVQRVVGTSGDLGDILDAGGGITPSAGLVALPVDFDTGTGDDAGIGGQAADVIRTGDGADALFLDSFGAPAGGNDQAFAGAGNDNVQSGQGNDTVDLGDGDDFGSGGPGDDTVTGGAGDDSVLGGPGSDKLFGNDGSDFFDAENCNGVICGFSGAQALGSDEITGGAGVDSISYAADTAGGGDPAGTAVNVSLDDVQNDGRAGEPQDNVHSDVEDVSVTTAFGNDAAASTLTSPAGSIITNVFSGEAAADTINPGAGTDFVFADCSQFGCGGGGGGDDQINVADGYADRVFCGPGNDSVTADQFDSLSGCENVTPVTAANNAAPEDAPPTVAWTAPASGATMSTTAANTLSVNAADDKGVTKVVFMDDERIVCEDTAAPFTCDYKPTGEDVGRNTLVAIAYDAAQQTASAVRNVRVPRFTPTRLTASTTPKRDTSAPFRFTTRGRLTLPGGVSQAIGCKGTVTVQVKAGKKTISTRRAKLSKTCTYRSRVTFRLPARLNPKSLSVVTRFGGNDTLTPRSAKRGKVRVS